MAVLMRAYGEQTVWNFFDDTFDGPDWTQLSIDAGSNSTTVSASFVIDRQSVTLLLVGSFPDDPAASGNLHQLSLQAQAQVSAYAIEVNGEPYETMSTSLPAPLSQLLKVLSQTDRDALQDFFSGDDVFYGSSLPSAEDDDDGVNGYAGNDTFYGYANISTGDNGDKFYGGDGIDTLVLRGLKSQYQISGQQYVWMPDELDGIGRTITDTVGARDGMKSIRTVERITFADKNLALDTGAGENALEAMQFIGLVAPQLKDQLDIRGLILSLFDQGYSMLQMSQLALDAGLVPTNVSALANTIFANVVGSVPDTATSQALVGYIQQNGEAQFLAAVAGLSLNIDVVGIQQNGIEYIG
jgi:hypothetical protein